MSSTTFIVHSPTSIEHYALNFTSLNLPPLPPPTSIVSIVSTSGRRVYVATKGGVSGNKVSNGSEGTAIGSAIKLGAAYKRDGGWRGWRRGLD